MNYHDFPDYEFCFGPVPDEHFNEGDPESYFYDKNDKPFYYKLEMDHEHFYLSDTCGRSIPVDREFVKNMSTALFAVDQLYSAEDECSQLFQRRYDKTMQLLDFWNTNRDE